MNTPKIPGTIIRNSWKILKNNVRKMRKIVKELRKPVIYIEDNSCVLSISRSVRILPAVKCGKNCRVVSRPHLSLSSVTI